ncbi:MAG: site-2 protease family protein [Thermoplasmatota archaeon]
MVDVTLLVGAALVVAYVLFLIFLRKSGRLGKDFDVLAGFLLMWRTQRGKAAIERVSRAQRFWEGFGDVGIVLVMVGGVLMLLLLVLQVVLFVTSTQQAVQSTPDAQFLLGVPVLNPAIPLVFGVIGLVVALIVHEGAHGVLSRAQNLKVKSLGLLFAVVPIGAFVEPDEEDVERAPTRAKLRIFAAGPAMNIVAAILAAIIFSSVVLASTSYDAPPGVLVQTVYPNSPAAGVGIATPDVIIYASGPGTNASTIQSLSDLSNYLGARHPNDTVTFTVMQPGGSEFYPTVKLADRGHYFDTHGIANNRSNYNKSFLGIGFVNTAYVADFHAALIHPLASPGNFALYLYYPFVAFFQFDPLAAPYSGWIHVHGALAFLSVGEVIAVGLAFYWIFWLNFMIGTFNMLPAGFLDGGQMFQTALKSWLMRRTGLRHDHLVVEKSAEGPGVKVRGADPASQEKLDRIQFVARRTTFALGMLILGMLLLPVLYVTIVRAFG